VRKGADGHPQCFTRPVPPYLYPIEEGERGAYDQLRVPVPLAA
jgi:hypothetical protein